MIYLKTFQLNKYRNINNSNIYPFNVLKNKEPDIFIFDNITVLYGNNGSGKSTILNIIANKLNLKGKERHEAPIPTEYDKTFFIDFKRYAELCKYSLGEDEFGTTLRKIPENSRYIKSEEILYEIRKIQQDSVLKESFVSNNIRNGMKVEKAKELVDETEGYIQLERFKFSQDKYSNGETTLQILEENIEPDNLYLLDEPEVSLSPQKQVELANELNHLARYLGVQFIIATHSPFMLGILDAKIYNLDTKNYEVHKWSELDNVKYFYNFFKEREKEFET